MVEEKITHQFRFGKILCSARVQMTESKISESILQQRVRDLERLKSIEGKGSAAFSLIMLPPSTVTHCSASACMSYFAMACKRQSQMAEALPDRVLSRTASAAVDGVRDIRSLFCAVPANGLVIWSGCGVTTTGCGVTTTGCDVTATGATPEKDECKLEVRSHHLVPDTPISQLDEKTVVAAGLHHMYGTLTWTFGDRFFQLDEYLGAAKAQLLVVTQHLATLKTQPTPLQSIP